ncbi:hypothetical protein LCGC14_2421600 [marine sediment metagenome]|uniref:Alcohol dehydrogenase iron-type/glycerol dehydrogenase GldA domain-containing protein n=1 Tax=marine sediment metagenome TaxID=412755 RepID=A0A0F9CBR1_9ZZZZ
MTDTDFAFEMAAANLRYGPGVTREIGMDLRDADARRVLVVTDPRLADLPPVQTVRESLEAEGIEYDVYDRVRVEPNDKSLRDAIDFAGRTRWKEAAIGLWPPCEYFSQNRRCRRPCLVQCFSIV